MTLSSRRRELRASIRENIRQAENFDQEDDADKHIDQELRHLQHSHPQEHEATTNHDATKLINTIKREHEEHAGYNNAYDTIKVKREFDNKQGEDDDEEEEEEYQEENEHTEIPNRRRTRNKRQRIELSNTTVAPQTRTIFKHIDNPDSTICEHCGLAFRNVIDKRNHRRTHSQPKRHVCETCGKKFSQKANLEIHKTHVHHDLILDEYNGELPNQPVEDNSANIFSNDNNTKPPVNLKDVRVFHCNALQCGKGFISHDKLMDHIATEHPNFVPEVKKETKREKKKAQLPKVHECTFEECDKSFAKISDYKRHYRIHTGERPYICEHCGASFNQRYRLTTHTRIHTGEKPFQCKYCGKTFARGDAVQSHIFSIHRAKGEAF